MKIVVINCGSSSIKYQTFDMARRAVLASGLLEKIGEQTGRLRHRWTTGDGGVEELERSERVADHEAGFRLIFEATAGARAIRDPSELSGIGHRVVHGGATFSSPVLIDSRVTDEIRELSSLAPLHNPANLAGIDISRRLFPTVPQVAVFDTAFHHSLPPHAHHYALPRRLHDELRVRRYGFHGTSHQYVAGEAARHLGTPPKSLNLITLHLGNGASATAIRAGQSVDTSLGMTPLEGLVMGTRCGDLDPAIPFYLARSGMPLGSIEDLLNTESGLKGICGTKDMREVKVLADSGDGRAQLAIDLFCYRAKKYIGAYVAVLGRVDALVFTGGIGENAPFIRKQCCEGLDALGIRIAEERNEGRIGDVAEIQTADSPVKVLVIRTNEELEIARQTAETIRAVRPST